MASSAAVKLRPEASYKMAFGKYCRESDREEQNSMSDAVILRADERF